MVAVMLARTSMMNALGLSVYEYLIMACKRMPHVYVEHHFTQASGALTGTFV